MDQKEPTISSENQEWLQKTWRPAVGVTYIVINLFDFIIFPILWTVTSIVSKTDITPWHPLTLEATGLFHLSFGAILGVSAWSRGQEKMYGTASSYNTYRRENRSKSRGQYTGFDDIDGDEPRGNSATYRGENNE